MSYNNQNSNQDMEQQFLMNENSNAQSDNNLSNPQSQNIPSKVLQQQSPPPMLNQQIHVMPNQQMHMNMQLPLQQGIGMIPIINTGIGPPMHIQQMPGNQQFNHQNQMNQQNQQRFQMRGG